MQIFPVRCEHSESKAEYFVNARGNTYAEAAASLVRFGHKPIIPAPPREIRETVGTPIRNIATAPESTHGTLKAIEKHVAESSRTARFLRLSAIALASLILCVGLIVFLSAVFNPAAMARWAWHAKWRNLAFPPRSAVASSRHVSYDRFENHSYSSTQIEFQDRDTLHISTRWDGPSPCPYEPPETVSFYIIERTGNDHGAIHFIADGERISTFPNSYLVQEMRTEDLLKIANAKTVEMRGYVLSREDQNSMLEFLSTIRP